MKSVARRGASALVLALAPALSLAGCQTRPSIPADAGDVPLAPETALAALQAIQPATLRIHPLSRLERGPDPAAPASAADDSNPPPGAALRIAVHLELLDRFEQGVKGLGRATIILRDARDAGSPAHEPLTYVRDLSDPQANADAFDWVTRCYVIACGGLPEWAVDAARKGRLRIDAAFSAVRPSGARDRLEATLTLPEQK